MKEASELYNIMKLWEEPAKEIWEEENFVCEMNQMQHAFLCGIIREYRPKKIVELGVAEGGTTAVIMNALCKLELDSEFISVDLYERLYCDKQKETGYIYKEMAERKGWRKDKHLFLLGDTIAGQIESIGKEIEMIILDTTHWLPGEVLDFLCVLPYLAQNAMVVLHDIDLNYLCAMQKEADRALIVQKTISTRVLFSVVAAEKFLCSNNFLPNNIGAFRINADTYKYILNVVSALNLAWEDEMPENMLGKYRNIIKKNYDATIAMQFEEAVRRNKEMTRKLKKPESIWKRLKEILSDIWHIVCRPKR